MKETGNLFNVVSSLRHTSSSVLAGEGWQNSVSATHDKLFSVCEGFCDRSGLDSNRMHCISRKVRTKHATCSLELSCWEMAFGKPLILGATTGLRTLEFTNCLASHNFFK